MSPVDSGGKIAGGLRQTSLGSPRLQALPVDFLVRYAASERLLFNWLFS
jgi:hypothetical protein